MNKTSLFLIIAFSVFFVSCSKNKPDHTTLKDSSQNDSSGRTGQTTDNTSAGDKVKPVTDSLTITTEDSKKLSSVFTYNSDKKETPEPLVILIHQFRQSKEQWQEDLKDSILNSGYKILAFDIRGHGQSSKISGGLTELLSDPEQLPKDMTAVVSWAGKQKGIDSSRIAAVGASVGGNLALYGLFNLKIKTAVAISNGKKSFEIFTGYSELMAGRPYFPKMKNVLLICGTLDNDYEREQKWIMENFLEDPKEMKVFTSDKHGMYLIEAYPEINSLIINWLKKYL